MVFSGSKGKVLARSGGKSLAVLGVELNEHRGKISCRNIQERHKYCQGSNWPAETMSLRSL